MKRNHFCDLEMWFHWKHSIFSISLNCITFKQNFGYKSNYACHDRAFKLILSLFIENHKHPLPGMEVVIKNIKFVYLRISQLLKIYSSLNPFYANTECFLNVIISHCLLLMYLLPTNNGKCLSCYVANLPGRKDLRVAFLKVIQEYYRDLNLILFPLVVFRFYCYIMLLVLFNL